MTIEAMARATAGELRASAAAHRRRGEVWAAGRLEQMALALEDQAGLGDALAETLAEAVLRAMRDGIAPDHARACWARVQAQLWPEEPTE